MLCYIHTVQQHILYLLGYSKVLTEHRRDEPVEEDTCHSLLGTDVLLLVSETGTGYCICTGIVVSWVTGGLQRTMQTCCIIIADGVK